MNYGYLKIPTLRRVNPKLLAEQEEYVRSLARQGGYELCRLLIDSDATGTLPLMKRPQGQILLDLLGTGDTLVVIHLNDLFRSAAETLATMEHWRNMDIDLVVLELGIKPVTSADLSQLFFGALTLAAEFENKHTQERIRAGKQAKRAEGGHIGGPCPFGYELVGHGKDSRLEPDPEQIRLIELMRRLRSEGKSLRRISQELKTYGFKLSHVSVGKILGRMAH